MEQRVYRLGQRVTVLRLSVDGTVLSRHPRTTLKADDPTEGQPCHIVLLDQPRCGMNSIHALYDELEACSEDPEDPYAPEPKPKPKHPRFPFFGPFFRF